MKVNSPYLPLKDSIIDQNTAQKMKLSIKDFFSKQLNLQQTADVVTFTEEILNGNLHFLCSETWKKLKFNVECYNFPFTIITNWCAGEAWD